MSDTTERPAEPGELCTCGRQAVVVRPDRLHGEVGACGIEGAAARPVLPCPWCRIDAAHVTGWCEPVCCPSYRLRAPERGGCAARPTAV